MDSVYYCRKDKRDVFYIDLCIDKLYSLNVLWCSLIENLYQTIRLHHRTPTSLLQHKTFKWIQFISMKINIKNIYFIYSTIIYAILPQLKHAVQYDRHPTQVFRPQLKARKEIYYIYKRGAIFISMNKSQQGKGNLNDYRLNAIATTVDLQWPYTEHLTLKRSPPDINSRSSSLYAKQFYYYV